ncbi:hypothetical protein FRB95_007716 [Tulasnella sp. JGI-2019a]|nr:hypothetical protein FRB95_007716 [Tulasnella sp. JGI-2019a]
MPPVVFTIVALGGRTDIIDSTKTSSLDEKVAGLEEGQKAPEPTNYKLSVLIACSVAVSITQGAIPFLPFACLVTNMGRLGWGLIFGVFQPWFKAHLLQEGMSEALMVLLPAEQAMFAFMTGSMSGRLGDRFGHIPFIIVGSIVFVSSILGCAFDSHLQHVYATQVFQGVGAGLIYPPCLAIAVKSWGSRRSFVNSVMMIGIPIYAAFATLVSRAILTRFGYRIMFLAFTGLHFILLLASLVPIITAPSPKRLPAILWIDMAVVKDKRFWCLAISVAFAAFALLPPFVFISVYTIDSLPLISLQLSVVPLAMLNIFSAFGRTMAALLVNHIGARATFVGVLCLAASSQVIWAFAGSSFPLIMLYACLNGAVGATFLSVLPSLAGSLFPEANKTSLMGSLVLFAAPGSFLGPFIFVKILHSLKMGWGYTALCSSAFQLAAASFALFAR